MGTLLLSPRSRITLLSWSNLYMISMLEFYSFDSKIFIIEKIIQVFTSKIFWLTSSDTQGATQSKFVT